MSDFVRFDARGVIGPSLTLLCLGHGFNQKAVDSVTKLLKANFERLTGVKPQGRKEFKKVMKEACEIDASLQSTQMIATPFFQNMKKKDPPFQELVQAQIVPKILKEAENHQLVVKKEDQPAVTDWLAGMIQTYMSEQQIQDICNMVQTTAPDLLQMRRSIGQDLLEEAGKWSVEEFDHFTTAMSQVLALLPANENQRSLLKFTGEYLRLFGAHNNPTAFGEEVLGKLTVIFRAKFFASPNT